MDSLVQMVLDSNWSDLTKFTEQKAANKLAEKINDKKNEIRARFNSGYDDIVDEQS